MKKKILAFTFIIILSSVNCFAQEPDLPPPLPTLEVLATDQDQPEDKRSFWDKFLGFFGFGSKEEAELLPQKEQEVKNSSDLPKETTNDLPTLPQLTDNPSELQLPKGFAPGEEQATDQPQAVEAKSASDTNLNPAQTITTIPEATREEIKPDLPVPSIEEKPDEPTKEIKPAEATTNGTDIPASKDSAVNQDTALQLPSDNINHEKNTVTDAQLAPEQKAETQKLVAEATKVENTDQNDQQTDKEADKGANDAKEDAKKEVEENVNIGHYRKQLQERLNKAKPLPVISEDDRKTIIPTEPPEELDPKQLKFVNDEAQVLILPDDEMVLGMLTQEAQIELIDFSSYVKLFWDNYNIIKNEPARRAVDHFIDTYNNKPLLSQKEIRDAFLEAADAIEKGKIYDLIALLDNYPILQLTDQNGDTLLHKAAYSSNYPAVKLLLMKGISASKANYKNLTALDIAAKKNKVNIVILLKSAGAM